jgi:hypothetical protein
MGVTGDLFSFTSFPSVLWRDIKATDPGGKPDFDV